MSSEVVAMLEAASEGSIALDEALADALGGEGALGATLSLDIALALAERVLPGWRPMMREHTGYWRAHLAAPRYAYERDRTGRAPTPALALCVAILKARPSSGTGSNKGSA